MKNQISPYPWASTKTQGGKSKIVDKNGFSVCNTPSATNNDTANAKLIAAAPELLEKLTNLYNAIDSFIDLTPELLIDCRYIIKKATE